MKYSDYTKKDLIEVINNLEHNYNCQRERADNQFEMLKNMQATLDQIAEHGGFNLKLKEE